MFSIQGSVLRVLFYFFQVLLVICQPGLEEGLPVEATSPTGWHKLQGPDRGKTISCPYFVQGRALFHFYYCVLVVQVRSQ